MLKEAAQERFDCPKVLPTLPLEVQDEGRVVEWVSAITGSNSERVIERLRAEYDRPGSNVRRAFDEAGLERYCWSEGLGEFYGRTDSFLYELLMWNMNKLKRQMRRWIKRYLCQQYGRALKILTIGDGLGIDSLYLARMGHEVTYFEVGGVCRAFAEKLFAEAKVDVTMLSEPGEIMREGYDVVLCLDVLEHVPEPEGMVAKLSGYLRDGGSLITHAPFYMICKDCPTHLKANRKYCGSLRLFEKHGLRLVDGTWSWNPLVFVKTGDDDNGRGSNRLKRLFLRMTGLYIMLGRVSVLPFLWVNAMQRQRRRWFDDG